MAFPLPGHLGDARGWHFLMAWVLVIGSLIYVGHGFATGHFRRDFVPTVAQLQPRAVGSEIWRHLTFRRARGAAARQYNLLQRTAYSVVVFVLIPLEILSGLTMSSSFGAVFPQLFDLFGGRQSARTVHFLTSAAIVVFVVIHVAQVFVAGIGNQIGAMIFGRFTVIPEESRK
jgi:thiosulfate reductase cytochrome b subunit